MELTSRICDTHHTGYATSPTQKKKPSPLCSEGYFEMEYFQSTIFSVIPTLLAFIKIVHSCAEQVSQRSLQRRVAELVAGLAQPVRHHAGA